jgi:2-C-methyl-D-erythritol 4-phosphate cytidylyltransferase/2-C-methyl-D-erythritol 2,4-cyclodiphosphate synthase
MEKPATNLNENEAYLLIAAAGSGSRTGLDIPKQYQTLEDKTILEHTIEAFLPIISQENIRVIINAQHLELYESATKDFDLPPPIIGSDNRKDSIYNGLKSFSNALNEEIILIHDAARPFVKQEDILRLITAMKHNKAATLASPITDTIRKAKNNQLDKTINRQDLWAIQTPQAFKYNELLKAHKNADPNKTYTDDTSIISDQSVQVAIISTDNQNFKITTAEDLNLAKIIVKHKQPTEAKAASGYDVHRFTEGDHLILGGVKIAYHKSLKGHSDADVALHAITDALLGTISAGDIGEHFPPSDNKWKDVNSSVFLKKAVKLIEEKNGVISHIDLTIICEEPKIGPHKEKMKKHIAKLCNIAPSQINIKATTTEGLGFTGRKEGIAAQAMATVNVPLAFKEENIISTNTLAA